MKPLIDGQEQQIDPSSSKGKNLDSPLKIAKSRFSNIMDEIAGSPDRVSSLINKVTPSPKSKAIMKANESEEFSPFMQASSIVKGPTKKAEFLPAIGANRQNAHLRDFKYTPENIEKYLN